MQTHQQPAGVKMQVAQGISVAVYPNHEHEFLLPTKEVALGYGVSPYTIRSQKRFHKEELQEGVHFLSSVQFLHGASKGSSRGTMWTKRGIIRLGFFIKSERAKLFRSWAEDLIIKVDEHRDLFGQMAQTPVHYPEKRRHNRLTQDRLVQLLYDGAQIRNHDLRIRIVNQLMPRYE